MLRLFSRWVNKLYVGRVKKVTATISSMVQVPVRQEADVRNNDYC